jgi:SAM-dependent methyltransferase
MKAEDLKGIVKEKYGSIASQSNFLQQEGCCGPSGCCGELEFSMIGDEYKGVEGYNPDADLSLGCGLPTEFAGIKAGDAILDLGSGAGNDCFVARSITGESGKVTGLDFSEEMLERAKQNLERSGFTNMEFIRGDIEEIPLPDSTFVVVLSNCVLNLVPDKKRAFSEIFRVLKQGGHFCISDVVTSGQLPTELKEAAELYAGCVSGATEKQEYLKIIEKQGFSHVEIHKEKPIVIPENVLATYLNEQEREAYVNSGAGIYSITVTATKP